jgi:hypothetical protein
LFVSPKAIELFGPLDRERAQQQRVDEREDGSVGPQAKRQRQDDDECEGRPMPAAAERNAEIVLEPGSQVHRFTGSQVHRFTGSQVHGFRGSKVQRFEGSRVQSPEPLNL